jgi:hypothetical protein
MGTFIRRMVGAARLDANTYEDVEADRSATIQALAVVVLSSIAAGIGVSGLSEDAPVSFFAGTAFLALIAWVAWAFVMYTVGALILPTKDTHTDIGELLRTLGFAASPGLLQVFGALPGMRTAVFGVVGIWTLAATVVAVRQALDFKSTARALAVCGLGWALSLAVAVVLGLTFGPTLLGSFGM